MRRTMKEKELKVIELYWLKAPISYISKVVGIPKSTIRNILTRYKIGHKWNNIRNNQYTIDDVYAIPEEGILKYKYSDQPIKTHFDKDGYLVCWLNGTQMFVHRVIAMLYIPNPENKCCVNHKNGIKTDNRLENLEWVTHSENEIHSYKVLGKKPNYKTCFKKGSIPHNAIPVYNKINGKKYKSIQECANDLNVSTNVIYRLINEGKIIKLKKEEK